MFLEGNGAELVCLLAEFLRELCTLPVEAQEGVHNVLGQIGAQVMSIAVRGGGEGL